MNRIDIYDTNIKQSSLVFDRGYQKGLRKVFDLGPRVGTGGFGEVCVAVEKSTGIEYACKSIKKNLDVTNVSPQKQEQHLLNIDREIKVLKLLKGTLSVVSFKGAWEDDRDIHIVMEYCRGGELYHSIGRQPYTEERVSVYMRSVLQTLAQCHSLRILHRDIKPGNFLLLTKDEDSPLKAVDFGLAVLYEKGDIPRRDLGLDGTPWFMAPEIIAESETYPSSDVWSAGIMCYQLLSGHLPFDDARNRNSPSLSIVWKSILTDDLSFNGNIWSKVSDEAKGFVRKLLNKDPKSRPSASQALKDPWLQSNFHKDRKPRTLDSTVVQRLQRFAQANLLQRTILELVAAELLKVYPLSLPDPTVRRKRILDSESNSSASPVSSSGCLSPPGDKQPLLFPMSPMQGNENMAEKGSLSPRLAKYGRNVKALSGSSHGRKDYWRAMRQASEYILHSSGHGRSNYLHACSVDPSERIEQKKAARLSLDTSVHGTSKPAASRNREGDGLNEDKNQPKGEILNNHAIFFPEEENDMETDTVSTLEEGGRGRSLALEALQSLRETDPKSTRIQNDETSQVTAKNMPLTNPETLVPLMKKVGFRKGKGMSKESLMNGLDHIGYKVESQEVSALMERLGIGEKEGIDASEFIASQLDWKDLQRNNKELWIGCAKQAFEGLDSSETGHITTEKLLNSLREKIPDDELDYAVEDALVEAGIKDPEQVDFESFLKMVTLGSQASLDSLDKYDDRMRRI